MSFRLKRKESHLEIHTKREKCAVPVSRMEDDVHVPEVDCLSTARDGGKRMPSPWMQGVDPRIPLSHSSRPSSHVSQAVLPENSSQSSPILAPQPRRRRAIDSSASSPGSP